MSLQLSHIKRQCYGCGATQTYVDKKTGKVLWYLNGDTGLVLCNRCYASVLLNPKWQPITGPSRVKFGSKRLRLLTHPRVGVCNECRAVINEIDGQRGVLCKQTQMHHEWYDDSDPLAGTMELCARCHADHSNEQKEMRLSE